MKLFKFDILFSTLTVLGIMYLLTLLPNLYGPINVLSQAISDIDISDIPHSSMGVESKADTNIIIVNGGEMPRRRIAEHLRRILSYEPKVIGIDYWFTKPKSPGGDSALSEVIRNTDRIVMGSFFQDTNKMTPSLASSHVLVRSLAMFNSQKGDYAYLNIQNDKSFKTIREFKPQHKYKDSLYYSFPVVIAEKFKKGSAKKLLERNNKFETINYYGNKGRFIVLDIENLEDSTQDLSLIKDKIVLYGFVGRNVTDTLNTEDKFYTPFNEKFVGRTIPDMYGIIIHANVVSMVLNEDYIYTFSPFLLWLLTFFVTYLNIAFFMFIKGSKRFEWLYGGELKIIIVFELLILLYIVIRLFVNLNVKIEITGVLAALLVAPDISEIYESTIKEKYYKFIKTKFLKYKKEKSR